MNSTHAKTHRALREAMRTNDVDTLRKAVACFIASEADEYREYMATCFRDFYGREPTYDDINVMDAHFVNQQFGAKR